jgi:hypothetical protein
LVGWYWQGKTEYGALVGWYWQGKTKGLREIQQDLSVRFSSEHLGFSLSLTLNWHSALICDSRTFEMYNFSNWQRGV